MGADSTCVPCAGTGLKIRNSGSLLGSGISRIVVEFFNRVVGFKHPSTKCGCALCETAIAHDNDELSIYIGGNVYTIHCIGYLWD